MYYTDIAFNSSGTLEAVFGDFVHFCPPTQTNEFIKFIIAMGLIFNSNLNRSDC